MFLLMVSVREASEMKICFLILMGACFLFFAGGFAVGWTQAHRYWERVDNLENDVDLDRPNTNANG